MMSWLMLGVVNLLVIVALALQPYIAAKAVLFGVYVPEAERGDPAVSGLRRKFSLSVIIGAVLVGGTAAAIIVSWGGREEILAPVLFTIQASTVVTAYVIFRKAALRLKAVRNWEAPSADKRVVSLQFREPSRSFNSSWYWVHVIVVAVSAIVAVVMWDRIPDTLVTHYNGNWEADNWSSKTVVSVFVHNFIQLGMIGLFLLINTSIRQVKQVLDPKQPEQSMEREIRWRKRNAVFLWLVSLLIVVMFSIIQGSVLYEWESRTTMAIILVLTVLLMVSIVGTVIYFSLKGWGTQDDPSFLGDKKWKGGGLFYYNKEDPALFVPKRVGIGYTINFAQPMGWVIMGAILAAPVFIIVLVNLIE